MSFSYLASPLGLHRIQRLTQGPLWDFHPTSPAEADCPAAIPSAELNFRFRTPVPTDKAVISAPDTAALH